MAYTSTLSPIAKDGAVARCGAITINSVVSFTRKHLVMNRTGRNCLITQELHHLKIYDLDSRKGHKQYFLKTTCFQFYN